MIKSILKGSSRCSGDPGNALAKRISAGCERYKKLLEKKQAVRNNALQH